MASDSGRKRLLVLGAGPAQLGLLEAARERGLYTIAVDRDPAAPGFALADRRAIISTEDERGIERLAGAERVNGVIAPGIDWPVGIAARVAAKSRDSAPARAGRRRSCRLEGATARALRGRGGAATALAARLRG